MTFVCVPYTSISDLISKFFNLKISQYAVIPQQTNPAPNFVLIDPNLYYGSYGGILNSSLLTRQTHFISDTISDSLSIVWWKNAVPTLVGDQFTLSAEGRKAVTPTIFNQLLKNKITEKKPAKSSYYICDKPWTITFESSEYSDSE